MEITARSEWMQDQKQAVVMRPDKAFEVIQTPSGRAIFFSIGTDGVFYATTEVRPTSTGWDRLDLSSLLAAQHPDQQIRAKSFCIAQNPDSLYFDVALIINVGTSDFLYQAYHNSNTHDFWTQDLHPLLNWTPIPFDDTTRNVSNVSMDAVYIMNQPTQGSLTGLQTCFVDVIRDSSMAKLLDRYFIAPAETAAKNGLHRWQARSLPIDLVAGSIQGVPGRPSREYVGGLYTLGRIGSQAEVIFNPSYDVFDHTVAPSPTRFLKLSSDTTAIAAALNPQGASALFASTPDGVYVLAADQQTETTTPTLILRTPITKKAVQLNTETRAGKTVLYGINASGELWYTTCLIGGEAAPGNWSLPIALASKIQNFAFFVNRSAGNSTLFAHADGTDMFQLTQDPITGDWASRALILPTTDMDHVLTFNCFSTRLTVIDAHRKAVPNQSLLITSTSPVGVYVNDAYTVLTPKTPVTAVTNSAGVVVIIQPTNDSIAICYQVASPADLGRTKHVDPAIKAKNTLASIQNRGDLDRAQVQQADGTTRNLVPANISVADRDAVVAALIQLTQVANVLPADGSSTGVRNPRSDTPGKELFNIATAAAIQNVAPQSASPDQAIFRVSAGDLFRSILHTAWDGLKSFAVEVVGKIYRVVVKIGEDIYHAVLDCMAAIGHAVEWVFGKIQVFMEDLKNWLGFLFSWPDIVRTHKVIKTLVTTYAKHGIERIGDLKSEVNLGFGSLEEKLNAWAGIPVQGKTMGQLNESTQSDHPIANDPQTHYIHDKSQVHLEEAKVDNSENTAVAGSWTSILHDLEHFVGDRKDNVLNCIQAIKTQIIEPFATLTLSDIIKRLAAIIGTLVLNTAKSIINLTLDLVKDFGAKILKQLSAPIKIRIISKLYREVAGEELSIIDLICLAAAVPATLIYKAMTQETPFPDDSATQTLIQATDYTTIQQSMLTDPSLNKKLTIISQFVATAGLFFEVLTSAFKTPYIELSQPHKVHKKLKQIGIGVKLLIIMPNYIRPRSASDAWYWKFDAMVTDIALVKTCLEATKIGEQNIYGRISPFLDYAISAAWLVPAVAKVVDNHDHGSAFTTLTTSLAYDVAVMTGPIIWNPALDPESKLAVLTAADVILGVTGYIRVANGALLHSGQ